MPLPHYTPLSHKKMLRKRRRVIKINNIFKLKA